MKRSGYPSASVPRGLLLIACLGTASQAYPLPSDPANELFAIQIQHGNGFLEFPYGFLDPRTLEFGQTRTWRHEGPGSVMHTISAVDPAGGRFFMIGHPASIIVVDSVAAQAQEHSFKGFPEARTVFCLEYHAATRMLLGIAALRDNTGGRLVRIDPGSGLITPIGESIVPLASQAVSAVDWEANRFFVPGYDAEENRLSVLDLRTGTVLASHRVRIGFQQLRSIEWDPLDASLLGIFAEDFHSTFLARIDPVTGAVRFIGDLQGPNDARASTLDAAGRRLFYLAAGAVWVVDPETASTIDSSASFPGSLCSIHHVPLSKDARPLRRGDANSDGVVNLGDSIWLLNWLFTGGPPSPCLKAGDANDDGRLAMDDALGLLRYRFQGGPPPASPFPSCGPDPTPDALDCGTAAGC